MFYIKFKTLIHVLSLANTNINLISTKLSNWTQNLKDYLDGHIIMDLTQSYLSMFSQHVKTGLILYSNSSQQCLNNGIIFKSTTIISHHSCHMILFAFLCIVWMFSVWLVTLFSKYNLKPLFNNQELHQRLTKVTNWIHRYGKIWF